VDKVDVEENEELNIECMFVPVQPTDYATCMLCRTDQPRTGHECPPPEIGFRPAAGGHEEMAQMFELHQLVQMLDPQSDEEQSLTEEESLASRLSFGEKRAKSLKSSRMKLIY
jgi:hypothetical protein